MASRKRKERESNDDAPTAKRAKQGDGGSGGPVFADCCFVLSGTLSQQKSKVEALIKAHGGKVAASLTKAVTHVLAAAMGTGKADEGKAKGLPVLKESFLQTSIDAGALTTDSAHFWANAPSSGAGAGAGSGASKGKASASAEEKDDDEDEEMEAETKAKPAAKGKAAAGKAAKAAGAGAGAGAGGKVFAGLTFCLTGTLSMPKAKVEALIKANGGKIAGSVTGAVTHVVAAELGTGKADKAAEKGLPVVKEAWLMASIDAGKPLTNKHMLTEDGGDDSEGGNGDEKDDGGEDGSGGEASDEDMDDDDKMSKLSEEWFPEIGECSPAVFAKNMAFISKQIDEHIRKGEESEVELWACTLYDDGFLEPIEEIAGDSTHKHNKGAVSFLQKYRALFRMSLSEAGLEPKEDSDVEETKSSSTGPFVGLSFCVNALPKKQEAAAEKLIKGAGGTIEQQGNSAKYVVCATGAPSLRVNGARANGVPVVKESWIKDSLKAGKPSVEQAHFWPPAADAPKPKEQKEAASDDAASSSASGERKSAGVFAGLTFLFGKAVPKSMKAKLTQAVIAAGGSFDAPYFVSICGEDPGMSGHSTSVKFSWVDACLAAGAITLDVEHYWHKHLKHACERTLKSSVGGLNDRTSILKYAFAAAGACNCRWSKECMCASFPGPQQIAKIASGIETKKDEPRVRVFAGLSLLVPWDFDLDYNELRSLIENHDGSLLPPYGFLVTSKEPTGLTAAHLACVKPSFVQACIDANNVTLDAKHYWPQTVAWQVKNKLNQSDRKNPYAGGIKYAFAAAEACFCNWDKSCMCAIKRNGYPKREERPPGVFDGFRLIVKSAKTAELERLIKLHDGRLGRGDFIVQDVDQERGYTEESDALVKASFVQASIDAGEITLDPKHYWPESLAYHVEHHANDQRNMLKPYPGGLRWALAAGGACICEFSSECLCKAAKRQATGKRDVGAGAGSGSAGSASEEKKSAKGKASRKKA